MADEKREMQLSSSVRSEIGWYNEVTDLMNEWITHKGGYIHFDEVGEPDHDGCVSFSVFYLEGFDESKTAQECSYSTIKLWNDSVLVKNCTGGRVIHKAAIFHGDTPSSDAATKIASLLNPAWEDDGYSAWEPKGFVLPKKDDN